MLKNHVEQERPGEEELGRRLEEARKRLGALQMQIKEHGLPVLVLMEGWGTAGKGSTIGKIITTIARITSIKYYSAVFTNTAP